MKQKIIDYIEDLEWREQEYYKLQQKIDKAIEYINNCIKSFDTKILNSNEIDELIKILGDKE